MNKVTTRITDYSYYERLSKYTIDEVLSKVKMNKDHLIPEEAIFGNNYVKMESDRYLTFKISGTKCVTCGVEGQYFWLEKHANCGSYHFNLYALDSSGNEVLMTKDHIIPKSKGGKNHISNYQTMCCRCNSLKGDGRESRVDVLNKAINEDKIIRFVYKSSKSVKSRRVKPIEIKLKDNLLYLSAQDLKESDKVKDFMLKRIWDIKIS